MDMFSKRWVRSCNDTHYIDFYCFSLHGSFYEFDLYNYLLCKHRQTLVQVFLSAQEKYNFSNGNAVRVIYANAKVSCC